MPIAISQREQGKRDEVHALLAPVYGWFTEGLRHARSEGSQGFTRRAGGITNHLKRYRRASSSGTMALRLPQSGVRVQRDSGIVAPRHCAIVANIERRIELSPDFPTASASSNLPHRAKTAARRKWHKLDNGSSKRTGESMRRRDCSTSSPRCP